MTPDRVAATEQRQAGSAPEGWRFVRLGDLFEQVVDTGHSDDLPVLSVTLDRGVIRRSSLDRRLEREVERPQYLRARPGDIAYNTMRMWQGGSGLVREEGYLSPAYTVCRARSGEDPEFWAVAFKSESMIRAFRAHSQGFAKDRYRLYFQHFATVPALCPPLPEQRKIAAILASVRKVLELTELVIELLMPVKRSLANQFLGERIEVSGASDTSHSSDWLNTTLGACLREPIRNGFSPACPSNHTGKWILHLGAVTELGFNAAAVKPAPPNDPRVDATQLSPGDIVVSRSNTRERVGFAGIYEGFPYPCYYPDLLMRVRTNALAEPQFIEQSLLSERGRRYFASVARGTSGSMLKIDRRLLEVFPLALPPIPEQRRISSILTSVDNTLKKERLVQAEIQSLKNSLANALLTGQIRVTPDEAPA